MILIQQFRLSICPSHSDCMSWKCVISLLIRVIISVYWIESLVIITTMKDY